MNNIAPLIDDYGLLKAQIADLEVRANAIRDQIASLGAGSYEGAFYRVTVSEGERSTLNMKAVRAKLSRQFIQANTTTAPVTTVKVYGPHRRHDGGGGMSIIRDFRHRRFFAIAISIAICAVIIFGVYELFIY